jgi:hypothetical protein
MEGDVLHRLLHGVDFGEHGLTRNELRQRVPAFPEQVYLRLPDSKRFRSVEEILEQTGWHALARADGEFVDSLDAIPATGATAEGGPPAWGNSPLVESTPVIGAPDDQSITGAPEPPMSGGPGSTAERR